jgi:ribose transport system ATP-binding protein
VDDIALRIKNITKTFPGVKALNCVSFDVKRGLVHALVGENGAGKSTLMKILYGNFQADSGIIEIDGKPVKINSPLDAQANGISIIFQELNLIPSLSIAENIFLGRLRKFSKWGKINWKQLYNEAADALKRVSLAIDPKLLVCELSVAEKQMVEIAKSLTFDIKVLLMDEPSATLTKNELNILFRVICDLKAQGITVIYISHRMEEIFEICDTVTILRDGCVVDSAPIENLTHDNIVQKMVGREITAAFPVMNHNPGEELIRVEHIGRKEVIDDASFYARSGEVLGIAGLVGAGRTELCRMIFGADYRDHGEVFIKGEKVNIQSPADAIKAGVAYLTEDRKNQGLILNFSIALNITMANLSKIISGGLLNASLEKTVVAQQIKQLNIKTPSPSQKVINLSGGNQQKVVVSKWMSADVDIFIFDEPTRGIDVGAKYEIYLLINQLISLGKCVILVSSDLPEILGLSNRVLVMRGGKITGELAGKDIQSENVMLLAI